ncbi:toll/interleukin-1 receptor domain-containing protein [Streptomyces sp. NPDC020707]|uniref:toll/interleukin-1 receptor domain-containing protein n=1 Tax=Streptomyces sp. NPDC020707 TaxID=3365084 RepID=UPI0037A28983
MRYFVSYARRDNSFERLRKIRETLRGDVCEVYVDDLENHRPGDDRYQVVVDALAQADIFVAVESRHYLATSWTRWEFETALRMNIAMAALSPDFSLVQSTDPGWPWLKYDVSGIACVHQ